MLYKFAIIDKENSENIYFFLKKRRQKDKIKFNFLKNIDKR